MSRVADRLARALREAAAATGITATLGPLASRPWHAALFSGETHAAQLTGADDTETLAWLAALPELDLSVPGHVVDVAVDEVTRCNGMLIANLALQTIQA